MSKIYISAPITGMESTAEERFKVIEKELQSHGYETVNPYTLNRGYGKWQDAVMAGLRLLKQCDAIFMGDGWKWSDGCRTEFYFAKGMGIPIMRREKRESSL